MAKINPYIFFGGKAAEAFAYYKGVFGGETDIQLAKDGPNADKTPPEMLDGVFHGVLNAGDIVIMGSDMMALGEDVSLDKSPMGIAVDCDSADQLKEYFAKLVDGGKEIWPPRDSEWGSVYGQCQDKFGVMWLLNAQK